MGDEEQKDTHLLQALDKLGGGMSKERKNELYYGTAPKMAYFGMNRDLAHIHDLRMSEGQKNRLYGLSQKHESTPAEFVEGRLGSDSKSGLIREIAENSNLTRREAELIVNAWMANNNLVEVRDPELGLIIVPRRR